MSLLRMLNITPLMDYVTDNNKNGDLSSTIHMLSVSYFFSIESSEEVWLEKKSCWILSVNKENMPTFLFFYHIRIIMFSICWRGCYCEMSITNPIDGLCIWRLKNKKQKKYIEYYLSNNIFCTWQNAFSIPRSGSSFWFNTSSRM